MEYEAVILILVWKWLKTTEQYIQIEDYMVVFKVSVDTFWIGINIPAVRAGLQEGEEVTSLWLVLLGWFLLVSALAPLR